MARLPIRSITATQYVTPLREGGSLPAIVEGDDDGTYVLKFRGAGQGARALIAELVSGELARKLDLPVPEIVFAHLDPRMARTEPDPEIQDLLRRSEGLNLALDYLPGSITFDPLVERPIAGRERLASAIVWFDALVTNVDRTAKNTNLLVWHRDLWLIDHGATLIFHHHWSDAASRIRKPFAQIREHVLLRWATALQEVDEELTARLTPEAIAEIIELIPESWLGDDPPFTSIEEHRAAYRQHLTQRLEGPREWLREAVQRMEEAVRARTLRV
ncbi:MAG: HipA family kinase [Acidobacteriota bacterium]